MTKATVTVKNGQKPSESNQNGAVRKTRLQELDERKTAWRSLILCCAVMLLLGIQFSIYYNSIWPYLSSLDSSVSFSFMGICVSSYSVGQVLTSPLFGLWTQRTLSVKYPASLGIVLTIFGNLLYAMLPFFKNHGVQWWMLGSRFLVGLGSGNLAVFRAYVATASTPRDRSRAVSLSTGSFVAGIAIGPVIQTIFTPIGEKGWTIGGGSGSGAGGFVLNMYTTCALGMTVINLISLAFMLLAFKEDYRGILRTPNGKQAGQQQQQQQVATVSRADNEDQTYFVLPKFDRGAAAVFLYVWFTHNCVGTNLEAMSSPITQVLFNWTDREAILYNGIMQFASCGVNAAVYLSMSFTWIGRINPRKSITFGALMFSLYYIIVVPWPFYAGRLRLMHLRPNSTVEDTTYDAGCYRSYKWCPGQHHPPVFMYIIAYVFCLGVSFPFVSTPTSVLYSQVLGPRNQGNMQGLLAFVGGSGRIVAPVASTFLFEHTGYIAQAIVVICMLSVVVTLLFFLRRRLVPLSLEPPVGGKPALYKGGIFTRF